jgi:hypothetical protein
MFSVEAAVLRCRRRARLLSGRHNPRPLSLEDCNVRRTRPNVRARRSADVSGTQTVRVTPPVTSCSRRWRWSARRTTSNSRSCAASSHGARTSRTAQDSTAQDSTASQHSLPSRLPQQQFAPSRVADSRPKWERSMLQSQRPRWHRGNRRPGSSTVDARDHWMHCCDETYDCQFLACARGTRRDLPPPLHRGVSACRFNRRCSVEPILRGCRSPNTDKLQHDVAPPVRTSAFVTATVCLQCRPSALQ